MLKEEKKEVCTSAAAAAPCLGILKVAGIIPPVLEWVIVCYLHKVVSLFVFHQSDMQLSLSKLGEFIVCIADNHSIHLLLLSFFQVVNSNTGHHGWYLKLIHVFFPRFLSSDNCVIIIRLATHVRIIALISCKQYIYVSFLHLVQAANRNMCLPLNKHLGTFQSSWSLINRWSPSPEYSWPK